MTLLLVVVLFGVIFISLDLVTPDKQFFIELGLTLMISIQMRAHWYGWSEHKVDTEEEIIELIDTYDSNVVKFIPNTEEFEEFLNILNEENRQTYINNKFKNRTAHSMGVRQIFRPIVWIKAKGLIKLEWEQYLIEEYEKTDAVDFKTLKKMNKNKFRLTYRRMLEKQIGELRYEKLKNRYERKSMRIKKITSMSIMTRGNDKDIIDVRSKARSKKVTYQTFSAIVSFIISTVFASIMYKEIMLSWTNLFRYLGYIFVMIWTISSTVISSYRMYKEEVTSHLAKLQHVLDRYKSYKEGKHGKKHESVE